MGAIGVVTMSGAPESHLGILSREFQMPCVIRFTSRPATHGSAFPGDGPDVALAASAARHYARLREDAEVISVVDRFDDINRQLLAAMSAWQQVDGGGHKVANDHTDSGYDDKIITRIGRLVQRLDPLLDALTRFDPRFASYPERFAAALAGIDEGRHEFVSSPTHDSVHAIWFEFHEDLLRTMGRNREE